MVSNGEIGKTYCQVERAPYHATLGEWLLGALLGAWLPVWFEVDALALLPAMDCPAAWKRTSLTWASTRRSAIIGSNPSGVAGGKT